MQVALALGLTGPTSSHAIEPGRPVVPTTVSVSWIDSPVCADSEETFVDSAGGATSTTSLSLPAGLSPGPSNAVPLTVAT